MGITKILTAAERRALFAERVADAREEDEVTGLHNADIIMMMLLRPAGATGIELRYARGFDDGLPLKNVHTMAKLTERRGYELIVEEKVEGPLYTVAEA